ncbi:hypothetical protein THAOC_17297 [Thalassiosira oceanica]|uniref:Uncharacterized protein n=1 Tax=Thalassiosira oceanica TaxID=159749 RepID=K0SMF3_THAOC|nr:hypothetical protein THAOC_17297 [Thalassiosira oceanica]|eukprot:EJK62106.1 hypothetical protein THAOC_17297 [Thalassiosira oceanica]
MTSFTSRVNRRLLSKLNNKARLGNGRGGKPKGSKNDNKKSIRRPIGRRVPIEKKRKSQLAAARSRSLDSLDDGPNASPTRQCRHLAHPVARRLSHTPAALLAAIPDRSVPETQSTPLKKSRRPAFKRKYQLAKGKTRSDGMPTRQAPRQSEELLENLQDSLRRTRIPANSAWERSQSSSHLAPSDSFEGLRTTRKRKINPISDDSDLLPLHVSPAYKFVPIDQEEDLEDDMSFHSQDYDICKQDDTMPIIIEQAGSNDKAHLPCIIEPAAASESSLAGFLNKKSSEPCCQFDVSARKGCCDDRTVSTCCSSTEDADVADETFLGGIQTSLLELSICGAVPSFINS